MDVDNTCWTKSHFIPSVIDNLADKDTIKDKLTIDKKKLLVVEGPDAYWFSIWACREFGVEGIQVLDFGGIRQLRQYLKTLPLVTGYNDVGVETIVIARDAETDQNAAIASVKGALKDAGFAVPASPLEFTNGAPRTAYYLFSQSSETSTSPQPGTLEDLCLDTIDDPDVLGCVDRYLECLKAESRNTPRLHKSRLHAYLSGKDEFVGMKIGEAAKANAWNWNHDRLKQYKQLIMDM
ncbi:MAG: hypothetical protein HQK89_11485 [Nitrospirae bacterium]|nr:hypothetical protein [Nitrospirota bacterium]